MNPGWQAQENPPGELLQIAFPPHFPLGLVDVSHSLISEFELKKIFTNHQKRVPLKYKLKYQSNIVFLFTETSS